MIGLEDEDDVSGEAVPPHRRPVSQWSALGGQESEVNQAAPEPRDSTGEVDGSTDTRQGRDGQPSRSWGDFGGTVVTAPQEPELDSERGAGVRGTLPAPSQTWSSGSVAGTDPAGVGVAPRAGGSPTGAEPPGMIRKAGLPADKSPAGATRETRIKAGEVFGNTAAPWRGANLSAPTPGESESPSLTPAPVAGREQPKVAWNSIGEVEPAGGVEIAATNGGPGTQRWDGFGANTIVVSEADRRESERGRAEAARAEDEAFGEPQITIYENGQPVRGFEKGPLEEVVAPPREEEPLGFLDKIEDVINNPGQLVPFYGSGKELVDMGQIGLAAYRLSEADKQGMDADPADLKRVRDYLKEQSREKDAGYRIAEILAAMPAFAGEVGLTGGSYNVATQGLKLGAKKALKHFATKAGKEVLERLAARELAKKAGKKVPTLVAKSAAGKAAELGLRATTATAGALVQTVPASGLRVASDTIYRMMPQFQFSEDERGKLAAIVTQKGDDFGPAMLKAFGNQFAEVLSERTGGALAFLPGAEKLRLLKTGLMEKWFRRNPQATPSMFSKAMEATGWHGLLGEMFEERVSGAMKAGMGLQSWSEVMPGTMEDWLVEAAALAVPGAVGKMGAAVTKADRRFFSPGHPPRKVAGLSQRAQGATPRGIAPPTVPGSAGNEATEAATRGIQGIITGSDTPGNPSLRERPPGEQGGAQGVKAPQLEGHLASPSSAAGDGGALRGGPPALEPSSGEAEGSLAGSMPGMEATALVPVAEAGGALKPASTEQASDGDLRGIRSAESTGEPGERALATQRREWADDGQGDHLPEEPPAEMPRTGEGGERAATGSNVGGEETPPATRPASVSSPSVQDWGDIRQHDIGQWVIDRGGRMGQIYQIGRGAVAVRGSDGRAFGVRRSDARLHARQTAPPTSGHGADTMDAGYAARRLENPPADVLEYTDAYMAAVHKQPQKMSDLEAEAMAMVKNHPSGRSFRINYNSDESSMDNGMIYLRKDARRWEFIEEFSHWRMTFGDEFLLAEKRRLKKLVKKSGAKEVGRAAEEIAIKSYLVNHSVELGLESVDVEYLKKQIVSLWKYGAQYY